MTGGLGQSLFDPPNVAGWAGGRTWITPSTLLQRGNLFRDVLFPNVKGFRPPDRSMSATDAGVGERLAQGMDITEATKEGDAAPSMMAESNMMVDRDEDYNTRYGGYKGNLIAFERTKMIPRRPAAIDLTAMAQAAGADTVDKVVDHFVHRFLSVPLADKDRAVARRLPARQARDVDGSARRDAGRVAARAALSRAEHAGISVGIDGSARRLRADALTRCSAALLAPRFLARGLYGIGVGAGLPLVLSRTSAALTAQALAGHQRREASRAHSRRHRAVRRQRRLEHRRAVRRPGLLPRQAEARDPGSRRHQGRRRLRLPSVDGRLRAALQGRHARRRARLRLRPSEPVAFLVDGVLAHRRAQRRRPARLARPARRRDLRREARAT